MSSIEVTAIDLPTILKKLHEGEWQAPEFQRDFVWTTAQIIGLVNSIIDAKPIGMATLWQQEDNSDLPLEHISVADGQGSDTGTANYFGSKDARPGRFHAILDGKQRSTAMAMVFGGLKATNGKRKYNGSYFLNTDYADMQDRVVYLTKMEIERKSLNNKSAYVSAALIPLELDDFGKITHHFFGYITAIGDDTLYPADQIPSKEEIEKRQQVVQSAFDGIQATRLAVYVVPKEETLAEICDIFETLNTTGTKVSTVDLIHSWVYAETVESHAPIRIRDAIDSLSECDGMQGWPTSKNRPELIAQIVAAIQIALNKRHDPRSVSGKKDSKITSIKSSDLLAISSDSWRDFFAAEKFVATCFLDFQTTVAGGRFSLSQCPYPGVVNVYIAMRWYHEFDYPNGGLWTIDQLNRLFRAFFWRNTFSRRYDQGFMTRVGSDVAEFKRFLDKTKRPLADMEWATEAQKWLEKLSQMDTQANIDANIENAVSDGNFQGALRSGGRLLLHTRATQDIVEPIRDIQNMLSQHDLHHLYPKKWCRDNKTPLNSDFVSNSKDEPNWIESPANLIPMSAPSNKLWDTKEPSAAIHALNINSPKQRELLDRYFVDEVCLTHLENGADNVGEFLMRRRDLIARELSGLTVVK